MGAKVNQVAARMYTKKIQLGVAVRLLRAVSNLVNFIHSQRSSEGAFFNGIRRVYSEPEAVLLCGSVLMVGIEWDYVDWMDFYLCGLGYLRRCLTDGKTN